MRALSAVLACICFFGLVGLALSSTATVIPQSRPPLIEWLATIGSVAEPGALIPKLEPGPVALPPGEPAEPKSDAEPQESPVAQPSAEPAVVAVQAPLPKPTRPASAPATDAPAPTPTPEPPTAQPEPEAPKPVAVAPEPRPVEPTPVEPTAVEAKPVEPKPVEPKPVEPKPVEPKPVEAEPQGIGTLSVNSQPEGAAVFLNGANVGQTPIEIDVPSGTHRIRVVHPTDGTDKRQNVTVKPDGASTVDIAF